MAHPEELTETQLVMERRFVLPYNWMKGSHTRHVRQKNGIWKLAQELAGSLTGKRVLDAGCGDGWYSARMLQAGAVVSGIDYSARAIDFARLIVDGAEFRSASILSIPYPDETFDVVFSFQVLEHLEPGTVDAAVAELVRVTKKDGRIIVSVPSTVRKMSAAHFQHFSATSLTAAFRPHARVENIVGQDLRTPILWFFERIIQNRWVTLEALGSWFNRTIYLNNYNHTTAERGDNLMMVAQPGPSST